MKIVHLCLQSSYTIGFGYQDNLIPKYHNRLGHEVTIITTTRMREGGVRVETSPGDTLLDDGQRLIRLDYEYFSPKRLSDILRIYNVYDLLKSIGPDFIMVHGLSNISVLQVRKYVKKVNKNCIVVADNHMDYYNSVTPTNIKRKILIFSYRCLNRIMQKTYYKVYGVTPWRVQYQQDILGIKPEKSDLLIMGGDDEKIHREHQPQIRQAIRKKYGVDEQDFLIVTGGKIDKNKNIHLLMEAVQTIQDERIKLFVFGEPSEDIKKEFYSLVDNKKVIEIGWLPGEEVYDYFLASDLCVFPGTHSVLWEQACACGIPCIFKSWEGMRHVDIDGNALFLEKDSAAEIQEKILYSSNPENYRNMKKAAEKAMTEFSYKHIANRVIGGKD